MTKALVLYSGGLDSRLVCAILKKEGLKLELLNFILPFGCNCNQKESPIKGVKINFIDCTKEPALSEYLSVIKSPKFGTGTGINPCKDCKIFMFKKAKEYANKNNFDLIATGEVLGQRPMSQLKKAMNKIDEEIAYEILRPLCAKLLNPTKYEEEGLVKRENLYDFSGRSRINQIELARKLGINFPNPGGGCFLCEKIPSKRIKILLKKGLINENNLSITTIGRHFLIKGSWFVVSREEKEGIILESFKETIPGIKGKPCVYVNNKKYHSIGLELQEAFSKNSSSERKEYFNKFKI